MAVGRVWCTALVASLLVGCSASADCHLVGWFSGEQRVERLAHAAGTDNLQKHQPNGPSCEPTCFEAYLTYDGTGTLVG